MPLSNEQLRRDWIAGISGEAFLTKVKEAADALSTLAGDDRGRGALIAETEPVAFAAAFFAAVDLEVPIILANPNWGEQEWGELGELVSPAISFRRGVIYDDRRSPDSASSGVTLRQAQSLPTNDAPRFLQPSAILIPTGGTTGGVKLAIHSWDSLSAAVPGLQEFLGGGPIHAACQLPLHHVSGLMQLVRSFLSGGCIHFDQEVDEGDCLSLVPTQLQRAMESSESIRKMNTARAIFVGGAGMPEPLAARVRECRLPVIPVYGMTETAAMAAAVPNEDFLGDPQAGAVPLGEAHFVIEDGQIRVRAPALFHGYQGGAPVDRAAGYLTGDRGRLDAAGRLHVHGRLDRLINTGGEKVDPREVETALIQIEGIEAARVHGEPHPEWGQAVVADLCCAEDLDMEAVRAKLKANLSAFKVPKRFERMDMDHNVGAPDLRQAQAGSN